MKCFTTLRAALAASRRFRRYHGSPGMIYHATHDASYGFFVVAIRRMPSGRQRIAAFIYDPAQ